MFSFFKKKGNNLEEDVTKIVARCLGVDPKLEDNWVGNFSVNTGSELIKCEIYSTVLHIANHSLLLMNQHEIDTEHGKCHLVDYHSSEYNVRILRIPDPDSGEIIFMFNQTVNGEVRFQVQVDIDFVLI
jgi:hypothetical protein